LQADLAAKRMTRTLSDEIGELLNGFPILEFANVIANSGYRSNWVEMPQCDEPRQDTIRFGQRINHVNMVFALCLNAPG